MELALASRMESIPEALETQAADSFQPPQPPPEISLIDLILAATDVSEDEGEINDGIAALIQSGEVCILSREQDPMQRTAVQADGLVAA